MHIADKMLESRVEGKKSKSVRKKKAQYKKWTVHRNKIHWLINLKDTHCYSLLVTRNDKTQFCASHIHEIEGKKQR